MATDPVQLVDLVLVLGSAANMTEQTVRCVSQCDRVAEINVLCIGDKYVLTGVNGTPMCMLVLHDSVPLCTRGLTIALHGRTVVVMDNNMNIYVGTV